MDIEQRRFGTKEETKKKKAELTIITVFDNYLPAENSAISLKTGWGFACLVKIGERNILFDTGADGETLLGNMNKLKIEPRDINIVVLSHIHQDHTGGLSDFLKQNNQVKVYLGKSFPSDFKNGVVSIGAEIIEMNKPVEILESVYSTGELGTAIKEQSLVIKTDKGLVIITGCAHPGVVNIVKKAKELIGKNVYLVIGGFHLSDADDSELMSIISDFKKLGVEKAAPCHCSGDRCRELFKKEYKDDFIENGVGKIIKI